MLQDMIDKLDGYFSGIEEVKGYMSVNVIFPETFKMIEDKNGIIQVGKSDKLTKFIGDKTKITIDKIIEFIVKTIDYNKSLQRRIELYNQKKEELVKLFNTEDIKNLEKLTFSLPKIKNEKRKTNIKTKEENE